MFRRASAGANIYRNKHQFRHPLFMSSFTPQQTLGRLERIDVRQVWATEAGGFTPWLAQEENIELLGDAIGLDLEVEAQEKWVGPFRADILCKDTASENWVLIENQLERTDHTHLGQLLTYAAGLSAVSIVWVAPKFTEEHRATLDWLNEITDDRFNFFGLEIEAWRIAGSPIAPKFNIVSKPNDWTKTIAETAKSFESGPVSETKQLQREYWTELKELVDGKSKVLKSQKPQPQHWTTCAIGRSGSHVNALVNTKQKRIGVSLSLHGPNAKALFDTLEADKDAIEREVGLPLLWLRLPDNRESRIEVFAEQRDPTDRIDWPKQQEWLLSTLESFHRAFSVRVKAYEG